MKEEVGLAFVPRLTVRQELRDGTLVRVPARELSVPRRRPMIDREPGYVSESARELIEIVRRLSSDPLARTVREPLDLRRPLRRRAQATPCLA